MQQEAVQTVPSTSSAPIKDAKDENNLNHQKRFTAYGRIVTSNVPDLLCDDHDEEVERFMTLPKKRNALSGPCASPRGRQRGNKNKRRFASTSNAIDEKHSVLDSPTSRRRIQETTETMEDELRNEVIQWLQENLGWNDAETPDYATSRAQQQRECQHHHHHHHYDESMPSPLPLKRMVRIHHAKIPNEILKREKLVDEDQQGSLAFEQMSSARPGSPAAPHNPVQQQQVFPARVTHVKIHGIERVYDSLKKGNTQMFQCIGCQTHLLACQGTKLLYCTECGTLTPTEMQGQC